MADTEGPLLRQAWLQSMTYLEKKAGREKAAIVSARRISLMLKATAYSAS